MKTDKTLDDAVKYRFKNAFNKQVQKSPHILQNSETTCKAS